MKHTFFYFIIALCALVMGLGCKKEHLGQQNNAPFNSTNSLPGVQGTGYYHGVKISYKDIGGGKTLLAGDILLDISKIKKDNSRSLLLGTGRINNYYYWPNDTVFYQVDPSVPRKSRIFAAIAHWEALTNVRFKERTDQPDYVLFLPDEDSFSMDADGAYSTSVGREGGRQIIGLSVLATTGNIIHEIGHTVGMWHEHMRADRDEYITVNFDNIIKDRVNDFKTYVQLAQDGFETNHGGLDFGSIMMYPSYAFSANGKPTITKKDGSIFEVQRSGLSQGDITLINIMYPKNIIVANK